MACYLPKYAILTPQIIEGKLTKRLQFYSRDYIENNNLWDKQLISIIPCGKCIGCRLDKAQDWATRSLIEAKQWKNNCFITLTYNDKNLPKNASLYKKDLTDFWKRLRYYHKGAESRIYKGKEEWPIRYFSCGEYGGEKGRPHYHAGIFNWKPADMIKYKQNKWSDWLYTSEELNKIWGKGYVIVGEMTYESACYIARYVQKKAEGISNESLQKKGLAREFVETSRAGGIGYQGFENQAEWEKIKRNMGVFVPSKKDGKVHLKKIPNFIKNKWKTYDEYEYYNMNDKRTNELKEIINEDIKKSGKTPTEYRKMKLETLLIKIKRLKRNQHNV